MSRREPARFLSKAAEQVREFNHASAGARANWEFPSHSYSALGNLSSLVRMLPQAIEQAIRPVRNTYEHGRVAIDGGGDADAAVRDLVTALSTAIASAETLALAVDAMHSATSPMGVDTRGIPEFEDEGGEA